MQRITIAANNSSNLGSLFMFLCGADMPPRLGSSYQKPT